MVGSGSYHQGRATAIRREVDGDLGMYKVLKFLRQDCLPVSRRKTQFYKGEVKLSPPGTTLVSWSKSKSRTAGYDMSPEGDGVYHAASPLQVFSPKMLNLNPIVS